MSLTKLWNKNYFVQNILKSKAVIALVVGIVPILNAIFLMAIAGDTTTPVVADIRDISILNIIGMYVLPIVLSLCLFGYVFKKKSVDFINSMPLTRKTIYITNSIGGMLVIIVMMLLNVLLLGVESLIFSNLIIPFQMIIDYFILWTVSYIFVFTAANIATSLSGNHITMIVLTVVILFLVPFLHNYITGFSGNLYREPYYIVDVADVDSIDKEVYIDTYIEKIVEDTDYTWPYNYISCIFKGDVASYSWTSIIKMLVLSVIYFFVGMYLFEKRKMEVNETSFKSSHAHMLVKSLTLIPIGIFAIMLMEETSSFMVQLFILGLIVAYCLIYDLITAKSIRNFKLGAIYFIATAIFTTALYFGVYSINNKNYIASDFDIDEIQSVAFYIDEVDYTQKYVDTKMNGVYLEDVRLLEIVKENMLDSRYKEASMRIGLKQKNDEEYKMDLYLEVEDYNEIINILANNEMYMNEYKNIDYSKVQCLTVENFVVTGDKMEDALGVIKDVIESVDLINAYKLPGTYTTIDLKLYEDHENKTYSIPLNISEELLSGYVKESNKEAKKLSMFDFDIYDIRLLNYERTMASYYENEIESEAREKLVEYIKKTPEEQVDVTKPMIRIRMSAGYLGEYKNAEYFTNNVVEFVKPANNMVGGDLDE
ncbi:MAG: ABC transporter permease [Clostridia bacterium]|nr:ABC transporter permease [Clostridia bacterium]